MPRSAKGVGRFEVYLSFTRIELESVPSIFIVNNEFVKFIKINKNYVNVVLF